MGFVSLFSGGNLSNSCIFALGIMPYISASIILQLLASSGLSPALEKIRKEPNGQKKINEYTRYLTVPICLIQCFFLVNNFMLAGSDRIVYAGYDEGFNRYWFGLAAILTMTAGTLFLMWLGEQIDEFGIGNGISLIIMAGIVARIPDALQNLLWDPVRGGFKESLLTLGSGTGDTSFEKLVLLVCLFIAVVMGVIAISKGQRRIPTQSAKHVRGRRVYGGTRQFLPLKVNQAGVMPVIFASSLLILPAFMFRMLADQNVSWARSAADNFQRNSGYVYNVLYVVMIYFFCYFWTAITFNPKDMANNLKDYGSFISRLPSRQEHCRLSGKSVDANHLCWCGIPGDHRHHPEHHLFGVGGQLSGCELLRRNGFAHRSERLPRSRAKNQQSSGHEELSRSDG